MKAALALVLLGMLPGCASLKPADVNIVENQVPVICGAVDNKPDALVLIDTPPTMTLGPGEMWGYWFSPDLYGSLAENLQAMRRYQKQQRQIRDTLIACITDHNASVAAPPDS